MSGLVGFHIFVGKIVLLNCLYSFDCKDVFGLNVVEVTVRFGLGVFFS